MCNCRMLMLSTLSEVLHGHFRSCWRSFMSASCLANGDRARRLPPYAKMRNGMMASIVAEGGTERQRGLQKADRREVRVPMPAMRLPAPGTPSLSYICIENSGL